MHTLFNSLRVHFNFKFNILGMLPPSVHSTYCWQQTTCTSTFHSRANFVTVVHEKVANAFSWHDWTQERLTKFLCRQKDTAVQVRSITTSKPSCWYKFAKLPSPPPPKTSKPELKWGQGVQNYSNEQFLCTVTIKYDNCWHTTYFISLAGSYNLPVILFILQADNGLQLSQNL